MSAASRCTLFLVGFLGVPLAARAQQVTAATLPLKDKGAHSWLFFGDVVLGFDYGGKVTNDARVNAYSFSQQKFLWRLQDIESSHFTYQERYPQTPDYAEKVVYIGSGPFAALDVTSGTVRWHMDCDEAGFITRDVTQPLGATKLLIAGSDKCKWRGGADDGSIVKNLEQEKKLMLLDRATGRVIWTHRAKALTKKHHKFGACGLLGCSGPYSFSQTFAVIPVARGADGGYRVSYGDDVDRLLVVGERLEAVSFADGTPLWQTKDDAGSPAGSAGPFLFFVRDEQLNAYALGGAGTPAWSLPIHAGDASITVRSPGDSDDANPLGPDDLLVYTGNTLYRLALSTGAVRWSLPLGDANWQMADGLVFGEAEDKLTAYDFVTATPKWEVKAGRWLSLLERKQASGAVVDVFADRGEYKKDQDDYVGPYRFWGVDPASGKVVWSLVDLDGKKILRYGFWPGQLRVWGEKTVKCKTLDLLDGTAVSAQPGADGLSVVYFKDDKTVRAQNAAGDVVWERKGEPDIFRRLRASGVFAWRPKSGPMEIVKLADGSSLWREDLGGDPWLFVDGSGRELAITHDDKVTLLSITP